MIVKTDCETDESFTALILGLEKQVECLLAEIAARERDSLAQEDRVRALLKESEGDKERLGEAERSVQVHLSSLEMTKAKELSVLRRELALVTQNKAEQAGTLESLEVDIDVLCLSILDNTCSSYLCNVDRYMYRLT